MTELGSRVTGKPAEVLEDHIRLHLLSADKTSAPPNEWAEDLIDIVRAYLK
jgi:hypothetical protein